MSDPAAIRAAGIRYVRFNWSDNAGLIRAKAVHTTFIKETYAGDTYAEDAAAGSRIGLTPASQALPVMYDAPSPGSGLSATGEVHLCPDWATLCLLPYAPGHARVLCDIYDGDQPWRHCPRGFLRRIIARAEGQGLHLMGAFENEFFLLRPQGTEWAPVDTTVFAQTIALDKMSVVLDAITEALAAQGVQAEQLYAEAGPGQFEMPVHYRDALGAADQQIVFRETVRAVAHAHGLIATFVPKLIEHAAGSGAHLHFSLWRGDENVTADPNQPDRLSTDATAFVGGVLSHLPALMALTTPTTNSYRRIQPHFWSGAFACWGYANKEAAIRVPPAARPGSPVSNVELKTVDPTCNPYLTLGAVLAAGLDGIARKLSPGEPFAGDPGDLGEEDLRRAGIARLPRTLGEALAALESDAVLADALGAELHQSFVAVRRAEWEAMKDLGLEEEVRILLDRY
jgi:glutamine synthetase